ncbi:2-succinyl-5-enolpyruvyl-6-hydroxy-3-cyclohexene-1-carboxylic-acid synthase [Trebonia kvetii]|uniref:2-succinyl-5-enolpyruvyl-6-hydroxy-3-cyclohexene-1-carboxylate synthase n=1 Tax=Trebonia kvetii TaxID=2480626 RepID=A0A6P2C0G3_9ACTN|nr:2-succinyl-5-enolpyruvyl-6-hydroxy-3-cyclohexene-1-carboxylic-acid synthase [Trebonia kvetii]TVZ04919.1 2-succinyl-5-enolpyruvyl-6-hydroxy-3-cyclohexene-1-carboxylic-acid synthase [Trebonia kvetii]
MNPSTAFGTVLADELARCGLREVVIAPGSRSTPLAIAFWDLERAGRVRLHVRIDERSAAFTALGLAKASRRPVAVVCTSGTAAANFHPAVIEADESAVPLLLLTADRPPELRGTGASQTVDQVKLYGSAVRWYAESGVPERRAGLAGYWRSLACRAWAHAAGALGTLQGPVHLNLPFRDPLVPDAPPAHTPARATPLSDNSNKRASANRGADGSSGGQVDWPEPLDGRPDGQPWTRISDDAPAAVPLELPWTERGVVVCGDGDYDADALIELAERAGWPVLAEPSSGARRGPNALTGYQYLLASPEFMAALRPAVIVAAGRPGLTRPQSALLALARQPGDGQPGAADAVRHIVVAQGPGMWADPQRAATDVAAAIRLTGVPGAVSGRWLAAWRDADAAATQAAGAVLDDWRGDPGEGALSEPEVARELAAALPEGALLWCGNSLSVRDVDLLMPPRADVRVIASRGASGIDGTFSTAAGAAMAHAADRPGAVAFGLIGDLSLLHDAPGLAIGPGEPRPDLCVVVVNNDGGGIFAGLEPAAFTGPFERVFGTPHRASLDQLAAAFGIPYTLVEGPGDLLKAVAATAGGTGPRIVEARTARAANAGLRAAMRAAGVRAAAASVAS